MKSTSFPAVVIPAGEAPRGHSRETDSVVDDVIHLAVRQVLGFGLAHVWRFRIKILSDLRFPASVIGVARGAMVGEMGSRLAENFSCRRERILRVAFRHRDGKLSCRSCDKGLHC